MRDQARQVAWTSSWKKKTTQKKITQNIGRNVVHFAKTKPGAENLFKFLLRCKWMFPKAAKRLTSLTWKSRLMKMSLRRLELLMGVLKRVRCVCSTYVYLSGWGTHGNCVVGSCAFSVGRLGFKRVNLVLGVVCCVCVSKSRRSWDLEFIYCRFPNFKMFISMLHFDGNWV